MVYVGHKSLICTLICVQESIKLTYQPFIDTHFKFENFKINHVIINNENMNYPRKSRVWNEMGSKSSGPKNQNLEQVEISLKRGKVILDFGKRINDCVHQTVGTFIVLKLQKTTQNVFSLKTTQNSSPFLWKLLKSSVCKKSMHLKF